MEEREDEFPALRKQLIYQVEMAYHIKFEMRYIQWKS